jgi:hypothetical protein
MATADEYAQWIVTNADKKGTPDFETVSKAYQELRLNAKPDEDFNTSEMLSNAPGSLWKNTIGGLSAIAANPLKSVGGLMDIAAGGLQSMAPAPVRNFVNQSNIGGPFLDPEAAKRAGNMSLDVGKDLVYPWSSWKNFKNTMQEDPFRVLGDVSMLATGGASATTRLPGISNALSKTAAITNPMNALIKPVQAIGQYGPDAIAGVIGTSTGVGGETVKGSVKSGFENKTAFKDNIRGLVDKTDVLDQARQALTNMRADRSIDYKINMGGMSMDNTRLKFGPIDDALNEALATLKQAGHDVVGKDQMPKINELAEVVKEWRNDPSAHTAYGLDALKKRIDTIYPDMGQAQAQRVITSVRNAVKDTIVKQSPEYASTMAAYETAITLEKEIERALSLGKNASADTALRKLTSLARNNVNANYGYRLDLAKQLESQGNRDLMPAIFGQSMSSVAPRGLVGQGAGLGAIGSAYAAMSPAMLATLPFMSPKLMGEAGYALGDVARRVNQSGPIQNYLRPTIENANRLAQQSGVTSDQAKRAALLAAQAGAMQERYPQ